MSEEKNPSLDTSEYIPPPKRDFSHVEIPTYKQMVSRLEELQFGPTDEKLSRTEQARLEVDTYQSLINDKTSFNQMSETIQQLPKDMGGQTVGLSVDYLQVGEVKDVAGLVTVGNTQIAPRYFTTGAYRDEDTSKYDYEGFFSPLVIERIGEYMHKHRLQSDGNMRASDNWQAGIPKEAYIKSGFRHYMDWWKLHRKYSAKETIEDALCALIFNAMGYLFEILKEKQETNA